MNGDAHKALSEIAFAFEYEALLNSPIYLYLAPVTVHSAIYKVTTCRLITDYRGITASMEFYTRAQGQFQELARC